MGEQTKLRGAAAAVVAGAILVFAGTLAVRSAHADGAVISIDPPSQNVATDAASFTVNVKISGANSVGAWEFALAYDSAKLDVTSVTEGPFLKSSGLSTECLRSEDTLILVGLAKKALGETGAAIQYGCALTGVSVEAPVTGPAGDGVLATIGLKPKAAGVANLLFIKRELATSQIVALDVTSTDGVVQIGATSSTLQPTPTANAANLTPVSLPPSEVDPFIRSSSNPTGSGSSSSSTPTGSRSSTSTQSQPTPASGVTVDPNTYGPPAPAGSVLSSNTSPAATDNGPLSGGGDLATGGNGAPAQAGSGFPHAGYGPQPADPSPWWNRSEVLLFLLGTLLFVAGMDRRRRAHQR